MNSHESSHEKPKSKIEQAAELTQEVQSLQEELKKTKLPVSARFDELASVIPQVAAMVGVDQRSDYHSLTLDEHTRTFVENLLDDPTQDYPLFDLMVLAGNLHDLGKTSEKGCQVHPKDPEKRQYKGHEKESEAMAEPILDEYFELTPEQKQFVLGLIGLHAAALNLGDSFAKIEQKGMLVGKDLKSFDKFMKEAERISDTIEIDEKMQLILAFNKADKLAGYNQKSDTSDPKVQTIKKKAKAQYERIEQIQNAVPALVEAVEARRAGNQHAAVVFENGEYVYKTVDVNKKKEKAQPQMVVDGKVLGVVMKNFALLGIPNEKRKQFTGLFKAKGVEGVRKVFGEEVAAKIEALM